MHDRHQIIETLRTFAHRSDVERVDEAVQALQKQFGDKAVVGLADALSDDDDYVRLIALEVLGEWDGDTTAALPAAIRALDDPDRIVRIAAVGPVGQHSEKAEDAVPLLMKWLETDDEHSRLTAAALILRIDPSKHDEMIAVLAEGMESDDTGIRCLVAWLLSGLRDVTPDAFPPLRLMLSDEDEFVRSVVEEELGSMAGIGHTEQVCGVNTQPCFIIFRQLPSNFHRRFRVARDLPNGPRRSQGEPPVVVPI